MKLMFVLSEDWFFCSHFIERAVAAQSAGYEVVILTHLAKHEAIIKARGLKVLPLELDRGSSNPLRELGVVLQIWRAYRHERPDIVHHVALKPVLYGGIAARALRLRAVINAPVGMGFIFISKSLKARVLKFFVSAILRLVLNPPHSKVIFENSDDLKALVNDGYVRPGDAILIRGAGINIDVFRPEAMLASDRPTIILTARMLWDKGVGEFVKAARLLKSRGVKARFLLVGAPDPLNHASIDEQMLMEWQREGSVEWLGFRTDIRQLVSDSDIMCLPSYREGLPKSLLEAMACGKPIVTTDVPGCREAVANEVNGILVPARNIDALAKALERLIRSPELRAKMGTEGRKRAEELFSEARIVGETLAVYDLFKPRPQ